VRYPLALLGGVVMSAADAYADTRLAQLQAYGEHLAQECVVCHRPDGKDQGIPAIVGWAADTFVATMKAYRSEAFAERRNPVMVSVARSLNDEEITALAAYFGSLKR
jgi:cytochrome c